MHDVLRQILEKTKTDLEERKKNVPLDIVKRSDLDQGPSLQKTNSLFDSAMQTARNGGVAFIGEIKLASPSEPQLGDRLKLVERAKTYELGGADAISIVTERNFFKGDPAFVGQVKQVTNLPVLQKDFVIDPYQIYETKKAGADAILLIARLVEKQELINFVDLCFSLGLTPVVEIHNEEDFEKALSCATSIIAVNARDLDTMTVDVEKACAFLKKVPDTYIKLGFSGIASKREVDMYVQAGADGVLVGTSLMKTNDARGFITSLR